MVVYGQLSRSDGFCLCAYFCNIFLALEFQFSSGQGKNLCTRVQKCSFNRCSGRSGVVVTAFRVFCVCQRSSESNFIFIPI